MGVMSHLLTGNAPVSSARRAPRLSDKTYRSVLPLMSQGRVVERDPSLAADVKRLDAPLGQLVRLTADSVHAARQHRSGQGAARHAHVRQRLPSAAERAWGWRADCSTVHGLATSNKLSGNLHTPEAVVDLHTF